MTSHYNKITPSSATFVYTDLFINNTVDDYEIPRMLHIINHSTTDTVIDLVSKDESGASVSTGLVLAPEDVLDLEAFAYYQIGVKYESALGTGDLLVSGYNYHKVTK